MSHRFVVCAGCSRHVKAFEPSCPFCGGDRASARASTGEPFHRMAAAAAVAAGVATIAGCGSNQSPSVFNGAEDGANSGNSGEAGVPMFISDGSQPVFPSDANGGTSTDAAGATGADATSGSGTDAGGDAPMVVAFYGIGNPLRDGGSG